MSRPDEPARPALPVEPPPQPLGYAPPEALPEPPLILTLGSDLGVTAVLSAVAAIWAANTWGGAARYLFVVPSLSALFGFPLTLLAATRGPCRARAGYLAVGLTCNGLVLLPVLLGVYMVVSSGR